MEQASLIFEIKLFFNLVTKLLGICNFEQVVVSRNFVSYNYLYCYYISEYTNVFPFVYLANHVQNSVKYLRWGALVRVLSALAEKNE